MEARTEEVEDAEGAVLLQHVPERLGIRDRTGGGGGESIPPPPGGKGRPGGGGWSSPGSPPRNGEEDHQRGGGRPLPSEGRGRGPPPHLSRSRPLAASR